MVRIDIRLTDGQKQQLQEIATKDNRSITKEIIQLVEDRYKQLNK